MEYNNHPNWLYKVISVDNLEAIQKELLPVLYREIPNFEIDKSQFVYVLREKIEPYTPLYVDFIRSLGILDRWHYSAFITTNTNSLPVHVDSLDWQTRCYGLNLPLVNCEGTYTIFYNAEINEEQYRNSNDSKSTARLIKPNSIPIEIDRVESTTTMWINTCIPHAPVSTHSKPRAIISARFRPEVHDLIWE
jgi:hypothetical protein